MRISLYFIICQQTIIFSKSVLVPEVHRQADSQPLWSLRFIIMNCHYGYLFSLVCWHAGDYTKRKVAHEWLAKVENCMISARLHRPYRHSWFKRKSPLTLVNDPHIN